MTGNERRRLPGPKWLAAVAVVLLIWAAALTLWWLELRDTDTSQAAASIPGPTHAAVPVVTAAPQRTLGSAPEGTPVVEPVERHADQLVRQTDWLALARAFHMERALADILELTSTRYAGRAVGSPGGQLSGDWIAARFAEYGLQPAGDDGTYFQEFPVPYAELAAMPTFELVDEAGRAIKQYKFRRDYMIWPGGYSDGGSAEGRVLWVSDGQHDDYDNVDAVGAIVLCRWTHPFEELQRQALEHGARALLLARAEGANFRMRRTARSNALLPQGIPTLLVGRQVIEDLLAGSALAYDDLTIQYKSLPLTTRARIDVPLQYASGATGRNVLGVIPGSDADGLEQVFILGAHYDHIGADPDGTTWVGANDNASGVAVLLEIARLWQEHGFVPKRTVLFAAWDGEEIGLVGSNYYVEHPRYPLESTLGMLQLDMVGGGTPILAIDQGGFVADQSLALAELLGIAVRAQSLGSSDHVPFVGAGVPATLYIWWDGDVPGLVYHVPEDDIDNIEPRRLASAGQLAHLLTLAVAWDHEQLEDVASAQLQALAGRDVEAWLRALDPQQEGLAASERVWISSISARQPAAFTATVGSTIVAGDVATSTMTLSYRWQDQDPQSTVTLPVQWIRRSSAWYYGGPAWTLEQGQQAVVSHLEQPVLAKRIIQDADELLAFLEDEAGLSLSEPIHIRFYGQAGGIGMSSLASDGSKPLLYALETPPAGYDDTEGWPVEDGIVLSSVRALQVTLAQYALEATGWPTSTASWLAQGLVDRWSARDTDQATEMRGERMPVLLEAAAQDALWPVDQIPARHDVAPQQQELWAAQAWAVTDHLVQSVGWTALQHPVALTGDEWRATLLEPWQAATIGIEQSLTQRSTAVLGRDKAGFMSTIDPGNRVLMQEEAHWFDDLDVHPAAEFAYQSELTSLNQDLATATLTVRYRLSDQASDTKTVAYRARFVRHDGVWLYSDVDFGEERSDHFVLKYEHPEHAPRAQRLLSWAEEAYDQVTTDLEYEPTEPVEIKVYHNPDMFRLSIYMSMPPARGWNEPGEAIKLLLPASENMSLDGVAHVIAHELTHAALFSKNVQHGTLHEGTAQYEAGQFDPAWLYQNVRRWRQEVYDLVRSKRSLTFKDLADWRSLPSTDLSLMYSVGWDTVTYFRQRYGREAFLAWLQLLGRELPFDAAFLAATGNTFHEFDAAWRDSVLRGHIDPDLIETATLVDGQRALDEVRTLASEEWSGREVGTSGNEAAASYIATQFAEYGLQPAGDDGSYYQWFDARQTALIASPLLVLTDEAGETLLLLHGVDFRLLIGEAAGAGRAGGEIVYVKNPRAEGLRLGGRVMLSQAGTDPWQTVRQAQALGAGAILLMTDQWSSGMTTKTNDRAAPLPGAIPAFELSREASEALLDHAGYRAFQLDEVPPALPLPLLARVEVQLAVTPTVRAANVLGVLPGSDTELPDEVLLVGAHLDHVGRWPDGTVYPGANNDASGISVLLEIARTWHEMGYKPRRTVLFAAWNATELGLLGSNHYVRDPVFPLPSTAAMIQLDTVGQGKGYYILASANEGEAARILAHLENAAPRVDARLSLQSYAAGSDQDPFRARGVPSVLVSWEEPQYLHQPGDTAESIDSSKLQIVGRTIALTLMTMADE